MNYVFYVAAVLTVIGGIAGGFIAADAAEFAAGLEFLIWLIYGIVGALVWLFFAEVVGKLSRIVKLLEPHQTEYNPTTQVRPTQKQIDRGQLTKQEIFCTEVAEKYLRQSMSDLTYLQYPIGTKPVIEDAPGNALSIKLKAYYLLPDGRDKWVSTSGIIQPKGENLTYNVEDWEFIPDAKIEK